jgi:hypothetical protein
MDPVLVQEISESVERIIAVARRVDFDLLNGEVEPVAQLLIEARYLASVSQDREQYELSRRVAEELRRGRGLASLRRD